MLQKVQRTGDVVEKSYASHILAIVGKADRSTMLALYDGRNNLGSESLSHLSLAFALSGDNARARELINMVAMDSAQADKKGFVPVDVSGLSFAVLAQLEADPQSPRIGEWLVRLRKHVTGNFHWGTTWDNAHALLAFTANARRRSGLASQATFTFEDSAKPASGQTFSNSKGRVFNAAGSSTVKVTNKGTGPLYVFQSVQSVPLAKAAKAVQNGVTVERRFFDMDGKELALDSLKQGDSVVVGLELKFPAQEAVTEQMVIEDLLPACFEVDAGAFLRSSDLPWLPGHSSSWVLHREVRDDRVLLFSQCPSEENRIYYKAQVVSKGRYALPPISAEAMYQPTVKSRGIAGEIEVK